MIPLKPVRVIAPTDLPITLQEVKQRIHVDHEDDDFRIQDLMNGAIAELDGYGGTLGRAICPQTWRMDFSKFDDPMRLPLGDLISLTSIQYYDTNNAQQTASASLYTALQDALGPVVSLKYGQQWPGTYTRPDAVRVTWQCGFAAVPTSIKAAICLMVQRNYNAMEPAEIDAVERAIASMLAPLRLNRM